MVLVGGGWVEGVVPGCAFAVGDGGVGGEGGVVAGAEVEGDLPVGGGGAHGDGFTGEGDARYVAVTVGGEGPGDRGVLEGAVGGRVGDGWLGWSRRPDQSGWSGWAVWRPHVATRSDAGRGGRRRWGCRGQVGVAQAGEVVAEVVDGLCPVLGRGGGGEGVEGVLNPGGVEGVEG